MKNPITMFFHCKQCILDIGPDMSPGEYQDMTAGIDSDRNVIIWCNRHETIITLVKPERSDLIGSGE